MRVIDTAVHVTGSPEYVVIKSVNPWPIAMASQRADKIFRGVASKIAPK